jgi:hypothetical protein
MAGIAPSVRREFRFRAQFLPVPDVFSFLLFMYGYRCDILQGSVLIEPRSSDNTVGVAKEVWDSKISHFHGDRRWGFYFERHPFN